MFLATSSKPGRLLRLDYIGRIRPEELARCAEDTKTLLAELPRGFRLLADFSQLEAMDLACMAEIGRMMELLDQSGVGLIVRVFPDPSKDIGFNIVGIFHYPNNPRVITCQTMTEAGKALAI